VQPATIGIDMILRGRFFVWGKGRARREGR
jgi:hypothetical protein